MFAVCYIVVFFIGFCHSSRRLFEVLAIWRRKTALLFVLQKAVIKYGKYI
jgi:hypothetical protein